MVDAHWDDGAKMWTLLMRSKAAEDNTKTRDYTIATKFLIVATGPMHVPKFPDIKGLDNFPGQVFHSASWRHDIELKGKHVAVIGSGASAIQFVPEIQPTVRHLSLFQRTAPWVLIKRDFAFSQTAKKLFAAIPFLHYLLRAFLYIIFEMLSYNLRFTWFTNLLQFMGKRNIARGVKDPELVAKLTPNYIVGCKRILQSSTWYQALGKDNVGVVGGLTKIEGRNLHSSDGAVVTDVDVIIFASGFEVAEPPVAKYITGKSGKRLASIWAAESAQAYLGTMLLDCPNLFICFGPNLYTFSSAFIIVEAQVEWIVAAIETASSKGISSITVPKKVHSDYNVALQKALTKTVFNTGCSSYFFDKNGNNSTNWPWSIFYLRSLLSTFRQEDFECSYSDGNASTNAEGAKSHL
jgi:cation diffusion facilitator CzcD-associated flavoprotein CzcO